MHVMGTRIKDIARLADVSLATVSLVLNNKPGVGLETRENVLKIAQELQYEKPGSSATSCGPDPSSPAAGTIQFLKIARHGHTVNRDHTVFIADYIDGIVHGARTHNYKLVVSSYDGTPVEEILDGLRNDFDLQGAVVLGTELSRDDVTAFRDLKIPVVFLDTFIDFLPFDFIDMNNHDSVYGAIEHFLSNGHRKIGMVRSSVPTRNFQLRHLGFVQTMAALDKPLLEQYIFDCDSTFDGAYQDMRQFIQSGIELPTALFCTNDIIAFGVMRAIREAGYRIPDEISIIGFDDLPTAALTDPPLTSIAVSKREIGSTAVTRLTDRIRNPDMPVVKIVIGGTLIERNSVKDLNDQK
jgi:LacI family transcriptional regulator